MNKKLLYILIIFLTAASIYADDNSDFETLLQGTVISEITGDGLGIWAATYGNGVVYYSFKDQKLTVYSSKNGNLNEDMFYCIAANKDFVWAGSSDGLYTFDKKRKSWRKRKFGVGGELGNWIRALEYDKWNNVLWVGRFKYLTKLDLDKNRFADYDLTVNNDVKTNNIKSIALDGERYVWFGTEAGVHLYDKTLDIEDKNSRTFFAPKANGFNGDGDAASVADILIEKNNIWFGLDEFITSSRPNFNIGGIYKYNRKAAWERFDIKRGASANGVYCLERTGPAIWAGMYEFDQYRKEPIGKDLVIINRITGQVDTIPKEDMPLEFEKILSMYFDGNNMWLGTDKGLLKIKITNSLASWDVKKK